MKSLQERVNAIGVKSISTQEGIPTRVPLWAVEWLPEDNAARDNRTDKSVWESYAANVANLVRQGWKADAWIPIWIPDTDADLKELCEHRVAWWGSLPEDDKKRLSPIYLDAQGNLRMPLGRGCDGVGRSVGLPEIQKKRIENGDTLITEVPVWHWIGPKNQIHAVQNSINLIIQNAALGHSKQSIYPTLVFFDRLYRGVDGITATAHVDELIPLGGNKTINPTTLAGGHAQKIHNILKLHYHWKDKGKGDLLSAILRAGEQIDVVRKGSKETVKTDRWTPSNWRDALDLGIIPIHTGLTQSDDWREIFRCAGLAKDRPDAKKKERDVTSVTDLIAYIKDRWKADADKVSAKTAHKSLLENTVAVPIVQELIAAADSGSRAEVIRISQEIQSGRDVVNVAREYLALHERAVKEKREKDFFDHCKGFFPTVKLLSAVPNAPAPTQDAPAPVQDAPAPVQDAPAPVQDAPAPVQDAPAPVQDAPAPIRKGRKKNK